MPAWLWLLGLLLSLPAAADECMDIPLPSVSITRLEPEVTVSREFNHVGLQTLAQSAQRSGNKVLGLTKGNATVRYQLQMTSRPSPNGQRECASPRLLITYGFNPVTIYIARELPPGSCAYREVMAHEQRHLQVYIDYARSIEDEVKQRFEQRFAHQDYYRLPVGQAQSLLRDEMRERWIPYLRQRLAEAQSKQALIDTLSEYHRLANSCGGEIQRLLAPAP